MRQRNRVLIKAALTLLIMGIALYINQLLRRPMTVIKSGSDYMTRVFGKGSGRGSWKKNPGALNVYGMGSTLQRPMLITYNHTGATGCFSSKVHLRLFVTPVIRRKLFLKSGGGAVRMFETLGQQARWASIIKKIPNVKKSQIEGINAC